MRRSRDWALLSLLATFGTGCWVFEPEKPKPVLVFPPADSAVEEDTEPTDAPPPDSSSAETTSETSTATDTSSAADISDTSSAEDTADTSDTSSADSFSAVDTAVAETKTDTGPTCASGKTMCGATCVDTSSDRQHCGACGTVCAQACNASACRTVKQSVVAAGATCHLTSNGAVYCAGINRYDYAATPPVSYCESGSECRLSPTLFTPLANVKRLAASYTHLCALGNDGSVKCWGSNLDSELGTGTTTAVTGVHTVAISSATQIDVGRASNKAWGAFTCAVLSSGGVRCWGGNFFGQLGTGTRNETANAPVSPTGLPPVKQISTGGAFACALLYTDTVRCWGMGANGQLGYTPSTTCLGPACELSPKDVPGLTNVAEIAAGYDHVCARKTDGTVVCWGGGYDGQRGNGTTTSGTAITTVSGLSSVAQIASGDRFSCARLLDGSVWCWGNNTYGQLGDGSNLKRLTPYRAVAPGGASELAVGGFIFGGGTQATCIVSPLGAPSCWGANRRGMLADGTYVDRWSPTKVVWK